MAFINRPPSVPRHSLDNILETHYFTINHVSKRIIEQSHQTSARYPQDQSEFAATGLTEYWLEDFHAPFVEESPLKIGLRYVQHQPLLNGTVMVIGEIITIDVDKQAIANDGHIDIEFLGTVAVSGLDSYHQVAAGKRLTYAKPDQQPQRLKP